MKKTTLFKLALSCFIPALILSGCKKSGSPDEIYLKISDAAVSFMGNNEVPRTVKVYASPNNWDATTGAAWVEIANKTDNSFDIVVKENDAAGDRMADVTVKAGKLETQLKVYQIGGDHIFHRYRIHPEVQFGMMMSPSGTYVGGFYWTVADDNTTLYHPLIIDMETGERTVLGPYPQSLFKLIQPGCMADDGRFFIACENGYNIAFDLDGSYERIEIPAGYTNIPEIAQIAADGTFVGWSGKKGISYPFKWVDGIPHELPKPELNYRDEPIGDVQARGISANGKIIYGTTWDNKDYGMIYWDENETVRFVGEDVHKVWPVERSDGNGGTYTYNLANGMWCTDVRYCVSPNGKWIAGTYREESLSADGSEVYQNNYPAFYNTETRKTTIFYDMPGAGASGATSDGIGFTVNDVEGFPASGSVVDIENETVYGTASEWIKETYGIEINGGYLYYIPEKSDRALGFKLFTSGPQPEGVNWYILPEM